MHIYNNLIPLESLIQKDGKGDAVTSSILEGHIQRAFTQTDRRQPHLSRVIAEQLEVFIKSMKSRLWVNVESPYVDKVYRDSYYHYYASKLGSYSKDCIRLSFFDVTVSEADFYNPTPEIREYLQNHYLGFLVIRPTPQNPIGRNVLSPRAFDIQAVEVCQTAFPTTVNGIKLVAVGFPHSAQDVETVTCSQTTLWAVTEYFSHRYAEYRPILPSTIVEQLKEWLVERNLPAPGLSVEQLSYALKQVGFAPRIYHRDEYDKKPTDDMTAEQRTKLQNDFERLLSCYVESGIPVIVAVSDQANNGHATVCIGHQQDKSSTLNKLKLDKAAHFEELEGEKMTVRFFDLDQAPRNFVFIDDNHPPYKSAQLTTPTRYYAKPKAPKSGRAGFDGQTGEITAFVVPLYRKVYLDAYEAKLYVRRLLVSNLLKLKANAEMCLRLFLTSSRSYKDVVVSDELLPADIRQFIIRTSLPKLIWVAELTNAKLASHNQVFGVILLDATEADTDDHNALVMAVMPEIIINFAAPNKEDQFTPVGEGLGPFSQYTNNLNQDSRFYVKPIQ
ncbi:MAG: hypothetical protein EAZ91_18845 [Cytophagales bacterium]|nr:MAG: hypothetical protein EAZ91_18845 [Cytophagales bacterium]